MESVAVVNGVELALYVSDSKRNYCGYSWEKTCKDDPTEHDTRREKERHTEKEMGR